MTNIALLQVDLQELIEKRSAAEKRMEAADRAFKGGLFGILLGLLLLFLIWPLGLFLLLAGALASVTQYFKKESAVIEKNDLDRKISALRREIAGEPAEPADKA